MILWDPMGSASPINLWMILNSYPMYDSLRVPSRFILGFIVSVSLLAGFGLSFIGEWLSRIRPLKNKYLFQKTPILITIFILIDLCLVNSPIFNNTFTIAPMKIKENEVFSQRHKDTDFYGEGTSRSQKYPVFLSNSGTLDVNDSLGPYERGCAHGITEKLPGRSLLSQFKCPCEDRIFFS